MDYSYSRMGPCWRRKRSVKKPCLIQPNSVNYFDLEDPVSLARLEQPLTARRDLRGLVAIDEIQRRPEERERN